MLKLLHRSNSVTAQTERECLYRRTIVRQRRNVTFLLTPTVHAHKETVGSLHSTDYTGNIQIIIV